MNKMKISIKFCSFIMLIKETPMSFLQDTKGETKSLEQLILRLFTVVSLGSSRKTNIS